VLLDDLILDISDFQYSHPGGLYLLANTVGRDISKYFYGGYSHEQGYPAHNHSRVAKEILDSIAIGRLVGRGKEEANGFEGVVLAKDMINSLTAVITVKARHEKGNSLVKLDGDDGVLGQFGKHYLVTSG
jgi:cytochrome b involved in lipid metabolism